MKASTQKTASLPKEEKIPAEILQLGDPELVTIYKRLRPWSTLQEIADISGIFKRADSVGRVIRNDPDAPRPIRAGKKVQFRRGEVVKWLASRARRGVGLWKDECRGGDAA